MTQGTRAWMYIVNVGLLPLLPLSGRNRGLCAEQEIVLAESRPDLASDSSSLGLSNLCLRPKS